VSEKTITKDKIECGEVANKIRLPKNAQGVQTGIFSAEKWLFLQLQRASSADDKKRSFLTVRWSVGLGVILYS
jgi:hypothetical protein